MKAFLLIVLATCLASPYVGEEIPVEEYVHGYLDGIGEKESIKDFEACIGNIEPYMHKIHEAMELFLKLDREDLDKAIKILMGVYHDVHKKLQPCMKKSSMLKKLIDAMEHANPLKILSKILFHPTQFFDMVTRFVNEIKAEHFYKAGKLDGQICMFLFMSTLEDEEEGGFGGFVEFLEGFLDAVDQKQEYQNLKDCAGQLKPVYDGIIEVIEILKKVNWQNLEEIIEALIKIVDIVEEIFKAIIPCKGTPEDLKKIGEKLKNIDPDTLMQKIMANIGTIISDLTGAINALKKKEFTEAGYDFGDLFYIICLKD